MNTSNSPMIGMVVPPATAVVPPEARLLYPDGIRFAARGLSLEEMTPPAYARALHNLDASVQELVDAGADAISLMGTSISFFMGRTGHDEIHARLAGLAGGLPTSTMALAVVRALNSVGARRIVIGSPYIDSVSDALATYLTEMGFRVLATRNLGIKGIARVRSLTDHDLVSLGDDLLSAEKTADALLLSCGALRTQGATDVLQRRFNVPVISSSQAGCWDAVRLVSPELAGDVAPGF